MYISQNYYLVFPQLQHVVSLYYEFEQLVHSIKTTYSVQCPYGCGQCCNTSSSNIESTVLEMLPLCVHLYETGTYSKWLDNVSEHCIFYDSRDTVKPGCCMVYEFRPLVCRLFGYSFIKNKYGAIVPVACSILKKQYNTKKELFAVSSDTLPLINAFSLKIMTIDPALGLERYPINEAFIKAMEYVMLKMELVSHQFMHTNKSA